MGLDSSGLLVSDPLKERGESIAFRAPPYRELASDVTYRYSTPTTPYTRYGDWFAWSCLIAGVALAGAGMLRREVV